MGHLAIADACRLPDCTGWMLDVGVIKRRPEVSLVKSCIKHVKRNGSNFVQVFFIGQASAVDQWLSQQHLPGTQFSTGGNYFERIISVKSSK